MYGYEMTTVEEIVVFCVAVVLILVLVAMYDNAEDIVVAAMKKTVGTYTDVVDSVLTQSTASWVDEYMVEVGVRRLADKHGVHIQV